MKTFNTRIYYKLNIKLVSPLSIGSGEDRYTDHDVIVDSCGKPFIPGTAIAGVLRSNIENADIIFGYIKTEKEDSRDEYDSKIAVYDARMQSKKFFITNRDCVKLKDKVSVPGAKFDLQAVEPGAEFIGYIELFDDKYAEIIESALSEMNAGNIRLGTKTTRGYGQVKLSVYKKEIRTANEWIDFDMFDNATFAEEFILPEPNRRKQLRLSLKSKGGISVREYSTDVGMPDYQTMGLKSVKDKNKNEVPVIPGTSWAGAFRSRFEEFAGEEQTKTLFGNVGSECGNTEDVIKSKIYFNETQFENGIYKEYTRNSIDRFSGATKDGALYTERTYYYGETELVITYPNDLSAESKLALCACIADLHNGFLAVGGLTSVGRGVFEITAINGDAKLVEILNNDTFKLEKFVEEVM